MKTRKSTAIKVGIGFGIIALAALCLTTPVRQEIFIAGTKADFSRVKSASEPGNSPQRAKPSLGF